MKMRHMAEFPRAVHALSSCWLLALAVLVGTGSATGVFAQPISFNPDDPEPTHIEFQPDGQLGEQVGRMEGVVDSKGRRFFLGGLNVMSPLIIQVFAKDETKPIDVSMHRYFWKTSEEKGRTDAAGDWGYIGRVHDEVGIELRSSEPSEFYILAWQGAALEPSFASAAFAPTDTGGSARSASAPTSWLIGLMVLLIVGAGAAVGMARRRRSAAAALLVLITVLVPTAARASDFESRLANAEARVEQLNSLVNAHYQEAIELDEIVTDDIAANSEEIEALWGRREEDALAINSFIDRCVAYYRGLLSSLEELSLTTASEIAGLQASIDALTLLVEEDRRAIPDSTLGGIAPMPSRCIADDDCRRCSSEAVTRLEGRLANYERLRVIYQTTNTYVERMTALGDAKSGWHQLEQAAWYAAKQKIVESQIGLQTAYRNKFDEFNRDLQSILQDVGRCEAQYGFDDWYNRQGVFFYNNIISSYRIQ